MKHEVNEGETKRNSSLRIDSRAIGVPNALISMALSVGQQRALALLPKITGFSSVVFSTLTSYTILRDEKKRSKVYHRLILGMCCADISSSLWLALSTWPIPRETGILWAVGSTTSCTFQGFFTQFGISSPIYNVSLSVYYVLTVRHSYREDQLRRWEPFFHVLPLLWAFGTAVAGLFLKIFNSANLWCWIGAYPGRNEDVDVYRWTFFYGPLWIAIVIVTVNLILVFLYVRQVTLGSEKHAFPATQRETGTPEVDQGFESTRYFSPQETPKRELRSIRMSIRNFASSGELSQFAKRRRQVANQCLRYAIAFYCTWIPITVRLLLMICCLVYQETISFADLPVLLGYFRSFESFKRSIILQSMDCYYWLPLRHQCKVFQIFWCTCTQRMSAQERKNSIKGVGAGSLQSFGGLQLLAYLRLGRHRTMQRRKELPQTRAAEGTWKIKTSRT